MHQYEYCLIDREDGELLYISDYDGCQQAQAAFRTEGRRTRILDYEQLKKDTHERE